MLHSRLPTPVLQPFVSLIWAQDSAQPVAPFPRRELVLPTGAMHLVISGIGVAAQGVVGGVRETAYCKQLGPLSGSVGAMLRPGAAGVLLGASASDLSHRHTPLDQLWRTSEHDRLIQQLQDASSLECRLALFEAELERRLSVEGPRTNPFIAHAVSRLDAGSTVEKLVADAGCSHRHLASRFAEEVGVKPKLYQRLGRFNRALDHLHGAPSESLADIAAAYGYSDQAHLTREFRDFAQLTPSQYRRIAPAQPRHVPLPA